VKFCSIVRTLLQYQLISCDMQDVLACVLIADGLVQIDNVV